MRRIFLIFSVLSYFITTTAFFNIAQAAASTSVITEVNYPYVAALARASILADAPVAPTTQKVTYQFESGVPIDNQNMIKEGTDNFISHFGNILSYSGTAIGIIAYSTFPGALALFKSYDPTDSEFLKNSEDALRRTPDPEKVIQGMGGWSNGKKRVVVIGAPYFKTSDPLLPTFMADPVVALHELAHELQASINKGTNMRNPVWLCEGGAQVIGAVMSVYQGKDYWAVGGRDQWSNRIPADRTIADLKIMEGEDPKLSEYTTGAALSEYLIAWGGFQNSLLANQLSFKSSGGMVSFRTAFQSVYGQSLDDFYVEALPYVNYVAANWKSTYASSPAAVAFITERLGLAKAAETIAAAPKIEAEKLISDTKAAVELKVRQDADALADLLPRFESEGCHAGRQLNAILQKLIGTQWIDVAAARGWSLKSTCPTTNQYVPWTNADVSAGTVIRWHISATNAWDWYSSTQVATGTSGDVLKAAADLKAKQAYDALTPAEKTAADLKVKQEVDAKVAAENALAEKVATEKALAEKAATERAFAAMKKTIITCVKGKIIKKVTAAKPTCPTGFKKK